MAQRHQRGWLKKETRCQGEMWVLFFRTTRKADGKRVENKIPIGLVRDFPKRKPIDFRMPLQQRRSRLPGCSLSSYSVRRACMGLILEALRAGSHPAATVMQATAATAMAIAVGSSGLNW